MLSSRTPIVIVCCVISLITVFSTSTWIRNVAPRQPSIASAHLSDLLHRPWQKLNLQHQEGQTTCGGIIKEKSINDRPPEPVDIYESLRQYAVNNTVIVVPINQQMLPFAENMVCSLRKINFDTKHLVFWTLGEEVGTTLRDQGLNTFHDPSLYGTTNFTGLSYTSDEFKHMMLERPKFFQRFLATGLDILFLDTDIIFYDNPFKLVDQSVDLIIGSDSREFFGPRGTVGDPFDDPTRLGDVVPPVCAGTFWMKSNKHTIKPFQIMQDVFEGDPSVIHLRDKGLIDDQRGFDVLLNDGRARLVQPFPDGFTFDSQLVVDSDLESSKLDVRIYDQALVASGHLFRNRHEQYQEYLERLKRRGVEKVAIHLNWYTGDTPKIEGAKEMDIWQLGDNGQCI